MEAESYWIEEGIDTFQPTIFTQGPWDPRFQHGGPPGALLLRQIERCSPRSDMVIGRISVDIYGPIPLAILRAHARLIRGGKSVEKLEAHLEYEGRMLMRMTAWRVKVAEVRPTQAEQAISLPENIPSPDGVESTGSETSPEWSCGYTRSTEWRYISGGFLTPGPAIVWARQRYPLFAGEEPSPHQRLILIADSANGVSGPLDIREWQFIPPELTLHIMRPPAGEWICLDAKTIIQTEGIGLTTSDIYDRRGLVGRSAQALLVSRKG